MFGSDAKNNAWKWNVLNTANLQINSDFAYGDFMLPQLGVPTSTPPRPEGPPFAAPLGPRHAAEHTWGRFWDSLGITLCYTTFRYINIALEYITLCRGKEHRFIKHS